ncbi:MAG: hypothetical protein MJ131_05065 [Lachnospiraceae bacterium]|nr:hypothetical protein [Lachnospiraceae bacterium]
MSQEKVNENKAKKQQNKEFHSTKKKKNIITALCCIIAAAAIGFIIFLCTRPSYNVNLASSPFDDAAISMLAGRDYDFSQLK